jgi:hypothetical protein
MMEKGSMLLYWKSAFKLKSRSSAPGASPVRCRGSLRARISQGNPAPPPPRAKRRRRVRADVGTAAAGDELALLGRTIDRPVLPSLPRSVPLPRPTPCPPGAPPGPGVLHLRDRAFGRAVSAKSPHAPDVILLLLLLLLLLLPRCARVRPLMAARRAAQLRLNRGRVAFDTRADVRVFALAGAEGPASPRPAAAPPASTRGARPEPRLSREPRGGARAQAAACTWARWWLFFGIRSRGAALPRRPRPEQPPQSVAQGRRWRSARPRRWRSAGAG